MKKLVGASCVNAVSSKVNLIIRADGKEYEIDFAKGKTTKHLYVKNEKVPKKKTGTEVHYVLDKEVWGEEWFDFTHIRNRLQELAYLNPGLTISFKVKSHTVDGSPVEMESEFHYPDGIKEFIDDSVKGKEVLAEPLIINDKTKYTVKIHPSKEIDGKVVTDYEKSVEEKRTMDIDIAIVYTGSYSSTLLSFVNNVRTEYGGDHETGFKMGVFGALKKYLAEKNLIKNDKDVESDDCREGMTAIVSIKLKDPNYEGQGKGKIRMNIVRQAVKKSVEKALSQYLEENDERAQKITEKVLQAIRAREAARKARAVSRGLKNIEKVKNVENLADCSCKDPEKSEIFLVEGRLELPSLNPLNCGEVLDRGESAAKNVQKICALRFRDYRKLYIHKSRESRQG